MTDESQQLDGQPIRCPVCQENMVAHYHRDDADPAFDAISFSCLSQACSDRFMKDRGTPGFFASTACAVPRLWLATQKYFAAGGDGSQPHQ